MDITQRFQKDYSEYTYQSDFIRFGEGLTSLKGSPKEVNGYFDCRGNKLTNLKHTPKLIKGGFYLTNNKLEDFNCGNILILGFFDCRFNPNLKNIKNKIIKNQIKSKVYYTDEGEFTFKSIKKEFELYGKNLLKTAKIKEKIKNEIDFGLSI